MNEYSYEQRHMGTDVVLSFICATQSQADTLAKNIFLQIHLAELEFSRFLPNSTLSQLNSTSSLQVSPLFMEVLRTASSLHFLTAGAFNPLAQVSTIGYRNSFPNLPKVTKLSHTTYDTDIRKININTKTNTITLGKDQKLDFGGLLKGFLATKLADYVMHSYKDCNGCIVNIGGDLATKGLDELHKPFIFMLYNPITNEEVPIALTNTSLATSGIYARRWDTELGVRHHIVDAETKNNPSSDLISASIIHPSGAVAEALAKLFIIKGVKNASKILKPHNMPYQYFCVDRNGKVKSSLI